MLVFCSQMSDGLNPLFYITYQIVEIDQLLVQLAHLYKVSNSIHYLSSHVYKVVCHIECLSFTPLYGYFNLPQFSSIIYCFSVLLPSTPVIGERQWSEQPFLQHNQ